MENYSVVLIILAITIGMLAFAGKLKVSYPMLLIVAGIAIGFIPALPHVSLNPEVVMLIFLPPLLYDAAFNISFDQFKTHISTISTLSLGLVFLTTCGIAVIGYYFIPGISWSLAFVLGAILSATDAVAALGVTKGLGLSKSTVTILEGESLVNDASALVAYRVAVAAVTGVSFVFWKVSLMFVVVLAGGFLVGLVLSMILRMMLKWVRTDRLVVMSLLLLMPFVALIGLQFPYVLRELPEGQILPNIGYALLITIVVLALRMIQVFLQRRRLQKGYSAGVRGVKQEALLDVRNSFIISWSGMRGIVSLAIAIGLPETLENGQPFPMRETIIFITVAVVLFTLLGQGLSLPWIVRKSSSGH
ncbi:possible sodium/hydrogen antiporter [Pedobacter sp. BAL39]|uniref:cation:proton antiporter n=1 Tax=Pedobacter sp. BAL39 TaxID=391596 RepID=UPI00015595D9|nr:cation:proton antiporter [Pedobacter sp. BAL39]EDM37681.1 possible sodium/hydrogen antiporter [Pedobacter sp. BAL39]